MGTREESSAAGNAMESTGEKLTDPYSADNLIAYRISLSLIDRLLTDGVITASDRRKAYTIITKRHGLSLDSIFAETT